MGGQQGDQSHGGLGLEDDHQDLHAQLSRDVPLQKQAQADLLDLGARLGDMMSREIHFSIGWTNVGHGGHLGSKWAESGLFITVTVYKGFTGPTLYSHTHLPHLDLLKGKGKPPITPREGTQKRDQFDKCQKIKVKYEAVPLFPCEESTRERVEWFEFVDLSFKVSALFDHSIAV